MDMGLQASPQPRGERKEFNNKNTDDVDPYNPFAAITFGDETNEAEDEYMNYFYSYDAGEDSQAHMPAETTIHGATANFSASTERNGTTQQAFPQQDGNERKKDEKTTKKGGRRERLLFDLSTVEDYYAFRRGRYGDSNDDIGLYYDEEDLRLADAEGTYKVLVAVPIDEHGGEMVPSPRSLPRDSANAANSHGQPPQAASFSARTRGKIDERRARQRQTTWGALSGTAVRQRQAREAQALPLPPAPAPDDARRWRQERESAASRIARGGGEGARGQEVTSGGPNPLAIAVASPHSPRETSSAVANLHARESEKEVEEEEEEEHTTVDKGSGRGSLSIETANLGHLLGSGGGNSARLLGLKEFVALESDLVTLNKQNGNGARARGGTAPEMELMKGLKPFNDGRFATRYEWRGGRHGGADHHTLLETPALTSPAMMMRSGRSRSSLPPRSVFSPREGEGGGDEQSSFPSLGTSRLAINDHDEAAARRILYRTCDSHWFTFSGEPSDILAFRSLIANDVYRDPPPRNLRPRRTKGVPIEKGETYRGRRKMNSPFPGDILAMILLFVPPTSRRDLVAISSVCQLWRYYSNYAPHWTRFRLNTFVGSFPKRVQIKLKQRKIVTRDELILERQRAKHEAQEIAGKRRISGFSREFFVFALLIGFFLISWAFAVALPALATSTLNSDSKIATAVFFPLLVLTIVEYVFLYIFVDRRFFADPDAIAGVGQHDMRSIMTMRAANDEAYLARQMAARREVAAAARGGSQTQSSRSATVGRGTARGGRIGMPAVGRSTLQQVAAAEASDAQTQPTKALFTRKALFAESSRVIRGAVPLILFSFNVTATVAIALLWGRIRSVDELVDMGQGTLVFSIDSAGTGHSPWSCWANGELDNLLTSAPSGTSFVSPPSPQPSAYYTLPAPLTDPRWLIVNPLVYVNKSCSVWSNCSSSSSGGGGASEGDREASLLPFVIYNYSVASDCVRNVNQEEEQRRRRQWFVNQTDFLHLFSCDKGTEDGMRPTCFAVLWFDQGFQSAPFGLGGQGVAEEDEEQLFGRLAPELIPSWWNETFSECVVNSSRCDENVTVPSRGGGSSGVNYSLPSPSFGVQSVAEIVALLLRSVTSDQLGLNLFTLGSSSPSGGGNVSSSTPQASSCGEFNTFDLSKGTFVAVANGLDFFRDVFLHQSFGWDPKGKEDADEVGRNDNPYAVLRSMIRFVRRGGRGNYTNHNTSSSSLPPSVELAPTSYASVVSTNYYGTEYGSREGGGNKNSKSLMAANRGLSKAWYGSPHAPSSSSAVPRRHTLWPPSLPAPLSEEHSAFSTPPQILYSLRTQTGSDNTSSSPTTGSSIAVVTSVGDRVRALYEGFTSCGNETNDGSTNAAPVIPIVRYDIEQSVDFSRRRRTRLLVGHFLLVLIFFLGMAAVFVLSTVGLKPARLDRLASVVALGLVFTVLNPLLLIGFGGVCVAQSVHVYDWSNEPPPVSTEAPFMCDAASGGGMIALGGVIVIVGSLVFVKRKCQDA